MFVLYRYIGWILVIIMEINAILHIFFLYNILMPETYLSLYYGSSKHSYISVLGRQLLNGD